MADTGLNSTNNDLNGSIHEEDDIELLKNETQVMKNEI